MQTTENKIIALVNGNVYTNEPIKEITRTDFIKMLEDDTKGHFAISLQYKTKESKCSTKTPLDKRSFAIATVGTEYATKVNNNVKKETETTDEIKTEFKKSAYDKINKYLGIYPKSNEFCLLYSQPIEARNESIYIDPLTDKFVTKEDALNYFTPANRKPKETYKKEIIVNGESTEIELQFNWYAIKINNIEFIKMFGQVYKLID